VQEYIPFIIAGLSAGAIYGLAAVGLVLTFKTSGVFNFAHGALATVSAFLFYSLNVDKHVPWPLAAAVCILVLGPLMGLILERVARNLSNATLALQVAGTVGLLLVVEAGVLLLYNPQIVRTVNPFLAHGTVTIAGAIVSWNSVVTFVVAVAATTALSLAFRHTRRGLAMRAVVHGADLLDLSGTPPATTRRTAWVIGAMFAAASGVLFTVVLPLDALQLTFLVIQAFGAAAIGRFTNIPLTFVGGLVIGVLASLSTKWFTTGILSGIPAAMPFIVLFVVLMFTPKRFLPTRHTVVVQRGAGWTTPLAIQLPAGLIVLAGLALVPSFAGTHLTDWTVALATTILVLSLGLLVRTSGQVSLCQISFAAIGAVAMSHLAADQGIPWLISLILSGLIAVPIGALLSIPAIRLGGVYLALATFGFGVLLQYMFYTEPFMFGSTGVGLSVPRPSSFGFGSDAGFYRLVLIILVVVVGVMIALDRGRLGRLLRGLADSSLALRTNGVSVNVTRVLVFCLSAFLAAFAGALVASANTQISADSYPPLLSLTYFATVMIVVGREPWYALAAALGLIVIPSYFSSTNTGTWLQLLFGLSAVSLAMQGRFSEVPRFIRTALDPLRRRRAAPPPVPVIAVGKIGEARVGELELRSEKIEVRFGGHVAVDGLSVHAQTGRITGLIGPNGAGKTTTFDVLSGLRRPNAGSVFAGARDVTRWSASARARQGIGRTFQRMELFNSLSVRENVAIGYEGTCAGRKPLWHLIARPGEAAVREDATAAALAICGLSDLADATAGSLSTGHRRLVELARCVAGPYRVLLLDEPSSGLDHGETERFGEILQRLVREREIGILLVEHNMALVLGICDEIFVMDFGELVFHGSPDEVRSSDIVQAAYLGKAEIEDAIAPDRPMAQTEGAR
jgi:ABC-type branched-subunit amino acid transport system ATPase component/branched-subunit amino acid ABC-type transport system permease component